MCHQPVVSCNVLQYLTKLLPKPVRHTAKACLFLLSLFNLKMPSIFDKTAATTTSVLLPDFVKITRKLTGHRIKEPQTQSSGDGQQA